MMLRSEIKTSHNQEAQMINEKKNTIRVVKEVA
jgi:hypothetical protein